MDMMRIANYFECSEKEVFEMYDKKVLATDILMKWSKILEYDFFRIYSQHLILYAPPRAQEFKRDNSKPSALPQFRKNVYTMEIIKFIIELIDAGKKTKQDVISEYRIPKTTLYKWLEKYGDK